MHIEGRKPVKQCRAEEPTVGPEIEREFAVERFGLQTRLLLLALQVFQKRGERDVLGDLPNFTTDQKRGRDRMPLSGVAKTNARDRGFSEFLKARDRPPTDRGERFGEADRIRIEVLAGLTVALALVPEAVAFAFVAGVEPLVGLYAAFLVGLITAVMGGRPGMISGATGALAVVMVALVAQHGVEYLFATVVLMGILQVGAGVFKLGKFIRLVPHPVMLGFVNGLAIVIFLAQLGQFQVPGTAHPDGHSFLPNGDWLPGPEMATMLFLIGVTMLIIWGLPKLTKVIPAPLAGIAVVAALVIGLQINTPVCR